MRIHRFVRPLVLASLLMALSAASFAGVFVSVSVGPPPIPVYTQPLCPGPGYMWTPGYWAYGDDGYYWVPGTWVMAPTPGFLWTPGYWGFEGGVYLFHAGYWGPHVGFYGGINYGFGYGGVGFGGGEWRGNHFFYNRSVTNVNVTNVTNVYNKTVIVNNHTHVSYNGGEGGVKYQPSAREREFANERHVEATSEQTHHMSEAAHNPQFLAKNNGGKPAVAATAKPGQFQGHGVVAAKATGGPINHAALNANPKNTPAPKANAGANANVHGSANTSASARNVPKPPNAGGNTNTHTSASTSRNSGGMNAGSSARNSTSYSSHANNQPSRNTQTTARSAPPKSSPAPSHASAPRNEKPKR